MVKVKEDMSGWVMKEHGVEDSELTVLYQAEDYVDSSGNRTAAWMCQCSCGSPPFRVNQSHLRDGHTKTCGHNKKKDNSYDLSGNFGIGFTTNTNKPFYFDLEDYEKIKEYKWYEHSPNGKYKVLKAYDKNLHKHVKFWWIVFDKYCDHINHNTFDNRKSNLRKCTAQENLFNKSLKSDNTSGVIGVYFHNQSKKWVAYLNKGGKRVYTSPSCKTKREAIKFRLLAEKRFFNEFAPQQELFNEYNIN